jgi:hypothetical protein
MEITKGLEDFGVEGFMKVFHKCYIALSSLVFIVLLYIYITKAYGHCKTEA